MPPLSSSLRASPFFVRTLNAFGQKGGFAAYFPLLEGAPPAAPTLVRRLLKALRSAADFLTGRFLADFIPRLAETTVLGMRGEIPPEMGEQDPGMGCHHHTRYQGPTFPARPWQACVEWSRRVSPTGDPRGPWGRPRSSTCCC